MDHLVPPHTRREASSYGRPAKEVPQSYPGALPESSYLLLGDDVLPLELAKGRRVGRWRIRGATSLWDSSGPGLPLDDGLLRVNAAPVDQRTPVLAVGSNASPPQLVKKLGEFCDLAIPVVRACALGLRLCFSAHINPAGYIPASARSAADNRRLPVWVTFLDDDQLKIMDSTEPNYERVVLANREAGPVVELESGEELAACSVYRTRWGVLNLEASDGSDRLIPQRALRRLIESRCMEAIGRAPDLPGFKEVPPATLAVLLYEVPEIARSNLIVEDGLDEMVFDVPASYGQIDSSYRTRALDSSRGAGPGS